MDRRNCTKRRLSFRLFIFAFFSVPILLSTFVAVAEEELESLSAEKAFKLHVHLLNKNVIKLNFRIAPGYFLYHKHFQFRTLEGQTIQDLPQFPQALIKEDNVLGEKDQVYANQLTLMIQNPSTTKPGLRVQYQGCSENGFCYAPTAKEIVFTAHGTANIKDISLEDFSKANSSIIQEEQQKSILISPLQSELDRVTTQLKTGALPLTLLFFLGLGILLAFTPCVLPMIPILANILVGEDVPLSSRRAALLASLYVLSVAICYAIAGTIAGLMGSHLQITLQKPIFLVALSFMLLLFALNQLNFVHFQLPQVFSETLHNLQRKQKQGSIIGAIVMGGLSALMMSPCVTPALVGALTYIGQTGNALLGGTALFAMAIGMGLPLLCVACVGSHLLPKVGSWMTYIKIITGILLLALSGSILMRALPSAPQESTSDPIQFTSIQSEAELHQALAAAKVARKAVILDVYADWCISCKKIDQELFNNKILTSHLKDTQLLRLDVTRQTTTNKILQNHLKIVGPPTLLFFNMEGKELKNYRLVGNVEFEHFLKHLDHFLTTQEIK